MKPAHNFPLYLISLWILAMPASCFAIPSGGILEAQNTEFLTFADRTAVIQSSVYSYEAGDFVYTYRLTNTSSAGISFFSVGLPTDSIVISVDYDADSGVAPTFWGTVGLPAQSVDALFADTIDNDRLSSLVLWYSSPAGYTTGTGSVFGTLEGVPQFATGEVLVPLPEPATLTLLLLGAGLFKLASKRKPI